MEGTMVNIIMPVAASVDKLARGRKTSSRLQSVAFSLRERLNDGVSPCQISPRRRHP